MGSKRMYEAKELGSHCGWSGRKSDLKRVFDDAQFEGQSAGGSTYRLL